MRTDALAARLVEELKGREMTLATAESCTGGGIGHAITSVSGSSAIFLGGVISYANSVKEQLLGVPGEILRTKGAVSEETARAMAEGVRTLLHADLGVGVTGIAGPNSDGTSKPVGLVYVSCSDGTRTLVRENHFSGDRDSIRTQSMEAAMELVLEML